MYYFVMIFMEKQKGFPSGGSCHLKVTDEGLTSFLFVGFSENL